MKTSNPAARKANLQYIGVVLIAAAVCAGPVGAETFRSGGSTAIIEQSGGGAGKSEITRYRDGQKIVTQNEGSTDITIQEGAGYPPSDYSWEHPGSSVDNFDGRPVEGRFPDFGPEESQAGDCYSCPSASASETFRHRMFERMRSGFPP